MISLYCLCQYSLNKGLTRGGSRIFFRRGCTRLLLYFSTWINHIVFFFCRIPVVLENRKSSQGGVHTPCTLPLDPPLLTRLGFMSWLPNPESRILVRIWIFSGFYFFTNAQVSEFSPCGWRSKGKVKRIWARNHFSETPNPLSLPFWTPAMQASASLNARIFLTFI